MLYHIKPTHLVGDIIYPLQELKALYPDIYTKQMQKYQGREWVPENRIPMLNCTWADVVFLTAVHPATITAALKACGDREERHFDAFAFEPSNLDQSRLAVYEFAPPEERVSGWYRAFEVSALAEYNVISERITKAYYTKAISAGQRPFLFAGIPHILHRGQLSIAGLPVVRG